MQNKELAFQIEDSDAGVICAFRSLEDTESAGTPHLLRVHCHMLALPPPFFFFPQLFQQKPSLAYKIFQPTSRSFLCPPSTESQRSSSFKRKYLELMRGTERECAQGHSLDSIFSLSLSPCGSSSFTPQTHRELIDLRCHWGGTCAW